MNCAPYKKVSTDRRIRTVNKLDLHNLCRALQLQMQNMHSFQEERSRIFVLNRVYAESQSKSFNTFQSIGIIRTVFFGDSEIKLETSNKKITRKSPWWEKKHFITCSK